MNKKEREQQEAREYLRQIIKPGDTIYTISKHVSRSGMYRVIDLYVMENGQPRRISWEAAKLLEGYDEKHEGCKAGGAGMDMGFHLVYNLSYELYPDYECLGEKPVRCPSPDHQWSERERWNNRLDNKHHDGYALNQQWM